MCTGFPTLCPEPNSTQLRQAELSWCGGLGGQNGMGKGRPKGGTARGGVGAWIQYIGKILNPILGDPASIWAAQNCITDFGGVDPSSPIQAAAVHHGVRGIYFPCLRLSCSQSQPCAVYGAGKLAYSSIGLGWCSQEDIGEI